MRDYNQAHGPTKRDDLRLAPTEQMERTAAISRALGDAARSGLLGRLPRVVEVCVSESAPPPRDAMSTVSQRLRRPRPERLVARRRKGERIYHTGQDAHARALLAAALEHASAPATR